MYIFHYSTTIPSGFSAVGHPFEVGAKGIPTVTDVTDRLEKKNGNARSSHFGKKMTFELQLFVKITGGVRVFLFQCLREQIN